MSLKLRPRNKALYFSLLTLSFAACTNGLRKDDAIVRVNGLPVTIRDYQSLYETLKPKDLSRAAKESSEIKNLVLKTLVRRSVVLTEAKRKSISVSDQELESSIEKMKQGYTAETFRESLLEQMVDETEWKEQIRQNLLISKIFDATEATQPTARPSEALEFYEKNPNLFHQNAGAVALQIVVADKNLAEEIRKKLEAHPKDFISLARKHSIGPEAKEDAKIRIEKDTLPPALDKILFEYPVGKLSPIIETPYGFHILKVLEHTPSLNKDFEQAKPEILKRLEQEHRQTWLMKFEEDLIRSAEIKYNRELIRKL